MWRDSFETAVADTVSCKPTLTETYHISRDKQFLDNPTNLSSLKQLHKLESLDQCSLANNPLNYRMIEASGAKYGVQNSTISSFGEGVGGVEFRSDEPNIR
jgi:hypothetical protein